MADELWTTLKALQWTQGRFRERGLRSPRLDAELLLAHALDTDRVGLYTHHDQPLSKQELAVYRELIRRRLAGEPVAYLIGRQEFWSLTLRVDRRVLIPRPETEGLVEAALLLLAGCATPRIADVGTGSGAIAIALAQERPDADVHASDRSAAALEVARQNAERLGVGIVFHEGDLLAPLQRAAPFDLIVSNPPYIPDADYAGLPAEVRAEPREALLGGADGLAVIRRLISAAAPLLVEAGGLVLEVGAGQAPVVAALAEKNGYAAEVRRDLGGIERVMIARRRR